MRAVLAACGGFLIAVVWMDLIFDTQVLRHPRASGSLPEPVLASIAAYYRRATTDSRPMGRLIGVVMAVAVLGSLYLLLRDESPLWVRLGGLVLCLAPTALAVSRVLPDAVRLGRRGDDDATQSRLARSICRDHLLCLALVAGFTLLQLLAAAHIP